MKKFLLPFLILSVQAFADTAVYSWPITRVVDGDTVQITMNTPPPKQIIPDKVRVAGIDTPEHPPFAKCAKEVALANQATLVTKNAINYAQANNIPITFTDVSSDKYGRILARIWIGNRELKDILIEAKVGVPYTGGTKASWCS